MSEKYPECPLYNPLNCKEYYNPKVCAFVRKDKTCLRKRKSKAKPKAKPKAEKIDSYEKIQVGTEAQRKNENIKLSNK